MRGEGPDLLSFNEPDMSGQANMSPAQALSLWPQLMATGLRLGSPAVASGGATPGGWLDQFMSGATARGYRVNFITLHWYGSDFATGPAVSQLESYLQAVHARYHKPIWLTEFALANFGGSPQTPSRQAAGRVPHRRDRDAAAAELRAALRVVRAGGHADRRQHGPVPQRPGRHHGRPRVRGGRLSARLAERPAGADQPVPPARTRPVS